MDIQDRIDCAERALTRANDLLKNLLQRDGVTIRMAHLVCIAMADIDEAMDCLCDVPPDNGQTEAEHSADPFVATAEDGYYVFCPDCGKLIDSDYTCFSTRAEADAYARQHCDCAKNTPAPVAPETDVSNEDYSISSRPNIPPHRHKVKPRLVAKDPCKDCAQARPGGCPYTCAARNRYIAAVERYYSKTMLDV